MHEWMDACMDTCILGVLATWQVCGASVKLSSMEAHVTKCEKRWTEGAGDQEAAAVKVPASVCLWVHWWL